MATSLNRRTIALGMGAFYTAIGALGFVPGLAVASGQSGQTLLFGLLGTSDLLSVLHLAIGLVAMYALLVQAFLAYGMAAQAAAQGADSSPFWTICTAHDIAAAPDATDAPGKAANHCQICTLSASASATLPTPACLPAWQRVVTQRTKLDLGRVFPSFHAARAGLSRAPPQNG